MSFLIPESIESPRLHLRTLRDGDWPFLHQYYSDAEATRFTVLRPLNEEESRRTVARIPAHWERLGYGPYVLQEKATNEVLGVVGLWYPTEWPEPEIKWALARKHWGKGYAAEAARAVHAMSARYLPDLHLISLIHRENAASIRLALAVGAQFESAIPFRGDVYNIYRHRPPAADAA